MHELILINARCGGDPELGRYAEFLRRKLADRAQVEMLELESCEDISAVPSSLIAQLMGQTITGLPVVVLDGKVLSSGPLPNWMDSFEMIRAAIESQVRTT
jgi:hypothetical protein